jgi:hypothetical protein
MPRSRRYHPRTDPISKEDARESKLIEDALLPTIKSLPPEMRARAEAAHAQMDAEDAPRKALEEALEERVAALGLSPLERKIFDEFDGKLLLQQPVGESNNIDREDLIADVYGVKWYGISPVRRRRFHGRLRSALLALNRKLARENIQVMRCANGDVGEVSMVKGSAEERRAYNDAEDAADGERQSQARPIIGMSTAAQLVAEVAKLFVELGGDHAELRRLDRLNRRRRDGKRRGPEAIAACAADIRAALAAGPLPVKTLNELCEQKGYSPGTVRRAAERLGIRREKGPGYGAAGGWVASLPPQHS